MQPVLNALWSKLQTATGVGQFMTILGSRVYLDSAPGDAALPLCVYGAETTTFDQCMDGTITHVLRVTFTIYDDRDTTLTAQSAAAALRGLLEGAELTATRYDRVVCIHRGRGAPVFDGDIWSIVETYDLRGQFTP